MYRTALAIGVVAAILLTAAHESQAQRGGRGGGGGARGGGGGGARAGGGGGAVRGGAVTGSYGGGAPAARSSGSVIGPAGGTQTAGSGSGSYTTQRGGTIDYGAAGRGGTTPGGVNYGRGVGAAQVTTAGGHEINKVGTAGGISGPGGNAVGGRSGVTTGTGPGGSFGSAYHGGVAVGPQGGVAGGSRVGSATGAGGTTVTGGTRGAVAAGPYGAAAAGTRAGAAAGPGGVAVGGTRATAGRSAYGTYYASRSALATTGGAVRSNFGYYNTFNPGWYAKYPGAWFAAGWTAARIWSAPAWGTVSSYCDYPAEPVYYDYGESVVYSGDTVTINGETEVPAAEYAQQATDLAATGAAATVALKADDFQTLGVFAMVGEGETKSTNLFQLAVSKGGVIRGNYYNALTDTTEPVYGSVDKKTQRAAWTVGDRKNPVYETGIANLTKDESTMLVHYFKASAQQFTLVRIEQPDGGPAPDGK